MPVQHNIADKDIQWLRKRIYYGPWELNGLVPVAVDEGSTTNHGAEGYLIRPPKGGTNLNLYEVSDYGIVGLMFSLLAADDGNTAHFRIRCPYDLDPDFEIGFRINWTQISAVSDGTTWVLRVGVDKKDAAMLAEDAAGIAVLDTVIAEKDAGGSALENLWTSRGIKDDIGLTRAEIEDGGIIRMSLEADVVDTGQDEVIMLGLEMDYSPQRCIGEGSNIDSSLISTAST